MSARPSTASRTSSARTSPRSGSANSTQWKRARVVKCNPDPPQIPVRLRALYDGKLLFSPVPYLTKGFPYLRIDPERLAAKGVDFETAATAQGFMEHGEPVGFEAMPKLDFCVVGCVAVTRRGGRTGKGAGFADLEQGVFRELGLVDASTPIATTVHSSQLVEDGEVVMEATIRRSIYCDRARVDRDGDALSAAAGVAWDKIRADQFADIPFLSALAPVDREPEARAMTIDDPETKAEVEAAFAAYERALIANDVAALDRFFLPSEAAIRYGATENLYGYEAIRAFRAARSPPGSCENSRRRASSPTGGTAPSPRRSSGGTIAPGKIGRQMQTWIRFPEGWRIVAAHVSIIDEPAA